MRVRFGRCTLDTSSRELTRDGAPVRITGKAFRLLEVLVENRPAALSKDKLHDLVWPGTFVSDANLTSLITEIRKAIGDDAHGGAFVRTCYGFGYAFSPEVEDLAPPPASKERTAGRHRLIWGRKEIVLSEGENVLGRGPESIEWIDRDTVSRKHARIVVAGATATIEDLGSKNGTFVGGERITAATRLSAGADIKLGSVPLTFRVFADAASTATSTKARRKR
jgi:DNA-binding winged helix-turn-helix (wHTH) protein